VNGLKFALSVAQHAVFTHDARFRVIIAGRRFGKTFLCVIWLFVVAMRHPKCEVWYTASTYTEAKRIAWEMFKSLIPSVFIRKTNESELFLTLINGSIIRLTGREKGDSLRGVGLQAMVLDEFCVSEGNDKGYRTWTEVLRPMLADREGPAVFISTPKGFNWGYDLYQRGLDPDEKDWQSWQYTTLDGGRVSEEEVEAAKRDMDPRSFRQEFGASFESLSDLVYDYYDHKTHVSEDAEDDGSTIYVGLDFNVHPMTATLANDCSGDCVIFDAWEIPSSNTDEVAKELRIKFPDREIICCPDPSGKRRQSSAGGKTDFTILRDAGFEVMAPSKAPFVKDRINNTQAALKTADGVSHLTIHPRAKPLIKALQGLTYKEGTSVPDPKSNHIHITDAVGYLLWQQFNRVGHRLTQRKMGT